MARKKRLKIALIGYGAISQMLFDIFKEKKPAIDIVGVLVRPGRAKATQKADTGSLPFTGFELAIVLMLGLWIPPFLADWYRQAARLIG